MRPHRLLALAFSLLVPFAAYAQSGGNLPHGDGTSCNNACQKQEIGLLEAALNASVTHKVSDPANPVVTNGTLTRDLTNAALALLIQSPSNKPAALTFVKAAFKRLDTSHGSNVWTTYGENDSNSDPNSTEFAMIGLSAMLSSNRLSWSDFDGTTTINILAAMGALYNHVHNTNSGNGAGATADSISHNSNIYLMNAVSRMLMAQYLSNPSYNYPNAANDLKDAEDEIWAYIVYIQNEGVHEFDSPTYSATHMESLVEGFRYAADPSDTANFKAILDYLWMDIAANYVRGNLRVAGPFSRDYDFRNGQGMLGAWQEVVAGWSTDAGDGNGTQILVNDGTFDLEGAEMLDNIATSTGAYLVPGSSYRSATGGPTHVVSQMWGTPTNATGFPTPMRWVSNYGTVAMGCTAGYYGPQDKMFAVSLAGSPTNAKSNRSLALTSYVLDSTGNPYGTDPTNDANGYPKSSHVAENQVCATETGAALVSEFFDAKSRSSNGDTLLASNILFPINTGNTGDSNFPNVLIDGVTIANSGCTSFASGTSTSTLCHLNFNDSVVTISGINGGVIGVKVLEATHTAVPAGQYAYQLELDPAGTAPNQYAKSNGVGRIVVTHQTGSPVSLPTRMTFLVLVDPGTQAGNQAETRVRSILKQASFDPNYTANGIRYLTVTFNSSAEPGGTLSTLQVQRSDTVFTDLGYVPQQPIASTYNNIPLTTQDLVSPYTVHNLSADFWPNNPVHSTNSGYTCPNPGCSL